MQTRVQPKYVHIWEGEPLVVVALITTAGGTPVVTGGVSYVSISIFDMKEEAQADSVFAESPIDPSSVFFDTLQTDDLLNLLGGGASGYNFKLVIDSDRYVFQGGTTYRVQIVSQLASGPHVQVYAVEVGELL